MLGVVPVLELQIQTSVDTLLYLFINLIGVLFRSQLVPPAYLVSHKLELQLEVHL